jgi:hypothetical protein
MVDENNRMAEAWSDKTRNLESLRERDQALIQSKNRLYMK